MMFVYVVKGRDAVKVGVSNDPAKRLWYLSQLPADRRYAYLYCYEANLSERRLFFMVPMPDRKTAQKVERYTHWLMRRANLHGEWFWVDPETASHCILMAIRAVERGETKPFCNRVSRFDGLKTTHDVPMAGRIPIGARQ